MADDDLRRILAEIQRRGGIGPLDLDEAIAHAEAYVEALPDNCASLIDLGSGGGLPGVVIAVRRPEIEVLLVERRAARADLLHYAVRALQMVDHVQVTERDARDLQVMLPGPVDAVTARSFAAPEVLIPLAATLLRPDGVLVMSDPPDRAARWTPEQLMNWGFTENGRVDGVRRLRRST
jgi:16S rRNA (guanine527-N7)-methyltransferase